MLWGELLKETAEFMQRVRKAAGDNPITFSVSTRPILADTEDAAWERAYRILDQIKAVNGGRTRTPTNEASKRLLAVAAQEDVFDTCLFTKLAEASGAPGNSTALVGTPETVAQAMAAYYDLGATSLLIRGYDPVADAEDYGRADPRLRELVAERDAAA